MTERFERLGAEVARLQDEELSDDRRRDAVSKRLKARPEAPPLRARPWRPAIGLAAAGAAALVIWSLWSAPPEPIAYRVAGGGESTQVDQLIAAPAGRTVPVRFTDGASIQLEPGTRARVADLTPAGATLRIEEGAATVFVKRRKTTRWSVWAGPFLVRVTGTRFRLGWNAAERSFELKVFEGEVQASGPGTPERVVRGGQEMRVAPRTEAPEPPAPIEDDPSATRATPKAPEPREPTPAPAAQGSRTPPPALQLNLPAKQPVTSPETDTTPSKPELARLEPEQTEPLEPEAPAEPLREPWEAFFEEGQYEAALSELAPEALNEAIWKADSTQLMELSAAARHVGDRRAGSIYAVVRSRFPGTDAAADAAFMLARMQFHGGVPQSAATWLETYLRERPNGRFAREAAGRAIEAYQQAADESRAREAAERYLALYPEGPHAALARSVLE